MHNQQERPAVKRKDIVIFSLMVALSILFISYIAIVTSHLAQSDPSAILDLSTTCIAALIAILYVIKYKIEQDFKVINFAGSIIGIWLFTTNLITILLNDIEKPDNPAGFFFYSKFRILFQIQDSRFQILFSIVGWNLPIINNILRQFFKYRYG